MFERFRQDVQRWIEPEEISPPELVTPLTTLKLLWRHPPLRATMLYRLAAWFQEIGIRLLPGMIHRTLLRRYALELQAFSGIGGGLYIAHTTGCVIVAERIGRNCTFVANVTLGLRNEWAFPIIGDNVFVGAGARILGAVTVGNGAKIGANAVVIDDVPAGATAVGIPAQIISRGNEQEEPPAGPGGARATVTD